MGWLDVFCCSRREVQSENGESERLTAPRARGPSVTSQDGYGTMSMNPRGSISGEPKRSTPLSSEQRERMAAISRQAGSHMKSIGAYVAGRPTLPQPTFSRDSSCSRSSSPSPPRPDTSPPGGVLGGEGVEEVVHKSIFDNGLEPTSRRSSGSSGRRRRSSRRVSRTSK